MAKNTQLIYEAIISREPDKINDFIASQAARNESGDINKFLQARMKLKNETISIGFGGESIDVHPLDPINTKLIYDENSYAFGLINSICHSDFEIEFTDNDKSKIRLKYQIEEEDVIYSFAKQRQKVRVDYIKKTQTIGSGATKITGEFLKLTPFVELEPILST